jgi:hypothetical protein
MFDDRQRLRDDPRLAELLAHYAALGRADRTRWQDRLMHLGGADPKELTRLHGELIAFEWVEQNTGHAAGGAPGTVAACYRVTPSGLREVDPGRGAGAEEGLPAPQEPDRPRFPRKKKPKAEAADVLDRAPSE